MANGKTKYGVGAAGIQSLEIRGTTNGDLDKFALIANRNQLIASGKEDYVLSVRESLLADKIRKFRVPEIWDRQWTHNLGPIWTPASATASTVIMGVGNILWVGAFAHRRIIIIKELWPKSFWNYQKAVRN